VDNHNLKNSFQAGRVVDLKRMSAGAEKDKNTPDREEKCGFSISRFKKTNKKHCVDFLRHYKNQEKKEAFIEQEMLKEYLEESDEKKKMNALQDFIGFFSRVLRLWWLPLFIIRFVWILFWRIFKIVFLPTRKTIVVGHIAKNRNKVEKKAAPIVLNAAHEKKIQESVSGDSWKIFWQSLWSLPREVKNFLLGRTTEDYLLQKVLFDEMKNKKFHPIAHIVTFFCLSLLFVLPFAGISVYRSIDSGDLKGRVLGATEQAISSLQSAATAASGLDFKQASQNFDAAQESFAQADDDLSAVNGIIFDLGKIIPNDKVRLAASSREIVSAGEAAASLGNNLTLGINSLLADNGKTLSGRIDDFVDAEIAAESDAEKLNNEIAKIDIDSLPSEYRGKFESLKEKSSNLKDILQKNIDLVKKINIFLGSEQNKRYLLVFEDNAEMRASGGFIGSYALIDVSRGKITNIETPAGGSYDIKGGMSKYVIPPEPLTLITRRWYFWDANWWPDWEKSADKLSWFYEKSGGPTTDGVIAVTPTVLERILDIIGPVDMTDTNGMVMTSDNIWNNLRTAIENEKSEDAQLPYDLAENKPKKIIGQLTQKLMEELPQRVDREMLTKLLASLQQDLQEKQILVYLNDGQLQSEVEARNWAGKIKDTDKDYLLVVDTNIAGGKSDRFVKENISHQADVQTDGTIIDTVTINRTNTGTSSLLFGGERNVDWIRVYVPSGSVLLSVTGCEAPDKIYFNTPDPAGETDPDIVAEEGSSTVVDSTNQNTKIYTDSGKTVFANWSMINPGQTAVIVFKYKLPFKLENKTDDKKVGTGLQGIIDKMVKAQNKDLLVYSLLLQKQPGATATTISSTLNLPDDFKVDWNYPPDLTTRNNGWGVNTQLDSDKYWAAILERNNPAE
jgi:hypothetical protein